jgi:hypothetical protein
MFPDSFYFKKYEHGITIININHNYGKQYWQRVTFNLSYDKPIR